MPSQLGTDRRPYPPQLEPDRFPMNQRHPEIPHANMQPCAVVMAGGKGTRMKSDLPKVLCPVVDRPMIHFVIDALEAAGIHRQIVVVGYQADAVKAELDARGGNIQYALQQQQLGTGHAVQMCRDALAGQNGPTIVVAGDSPLIQPSSIKKLLAHFHLHQPALLLGSLEKEDPTGLGRIVPRPTWQLCGNRRTQRRDPSAIGCSRSQHEHLPVPDPGFAVRARPTF